MHFLDAQHQHARHVRAASALFSVLFRLDLHSSLLILASSSFQACRLLLPSPAPTHPTLRLPLPSHNSFSANCHTALHSVPSSAPVYAIPHALARSLPLPVSSVLPRSLLSIQHSISFPPVFLSLEGSCEAHDPNPPILCLPSLRSPLATHLHTASRAHSLLLAIIQTTQMSLTLRNTATASPSSPSSTSAKAGAAWSTRGSDSWSLLAM